MMLSWTLIYAGIFFLSLFLSLVLTPFSENLGKRLSLIDEPHERKFHKKTKARSGGIGIFLSFLGTLVLGVVLALALQSKGSLIREGVSVYIANLMSVMPKLIGLLAGAFFIFLVGLIDDRKPLNPWIKLVCQILSTVPLIMVGIRIQLFLPSWVGIILTIFWVVFLTNSFNFIDNMDGLSSGIAIIVCVVMVYVSWQAGEWFMIAMFTCLAGSILGFWYYNFIKSRLFMGDGGSLFIGYMIAVLTILTTYYNKGVPTALPVLTPLIILGVPLFDTISVMLIRIKLGKPLMKGDTNHFSHRLVDLGMSPKQAVIFIYVVTFCVALAALPLAYLPLRSALFQAVQVALWFVLIFLLERVGKKKIEMEKQNNSG